MGTYYTVEELLLNDSFLDYCRNQNSVYKNHWEQIIANNPEQAQIIYEAKQWLTALTPGLSQKEINNELNKVRRMIKTEDTKQNILPENDIAVSEQLYVNPKGKLQNKKIKRIFAYSSLVIIIMFSSWFLIKQEAKPAESNPAKASLKYQSTRASRRGITLPDGSVVILNTSSNISLSPYFNVKDRVVQLSGDAFFKVAKNPKKPFIVINNEFSITAIGTSFYVHARNGNSNYSVNLLEGKIKLVPAEKGGKISYLMAGEQAELGQDQSTFTKSNFDTLALKTWLKGKISFVKTPVRKALKQLEDWYSVDIEVQRNNLENVSITGDYFNVPLDDVLKVICFSLSCNYSYSGNKIIIK
jgi:ferric-dicitrate binding protein FerR (iron transport regulator)